MFLRSLTLAAGISILASVSAGWQTEIAKQEASVVFTVDSSHSTLTYRVRHMAVAYFHGRINKPVIKRR